MSNGEAKKLTREEVQAILEENAKLKADLEKVKASKKGSYAGTYAKQQERAARDPEYAAKLKADRKKYGDKRRAKIMADPELKAKEAAKAAERRAKQKAELEAFRAYKASQSQS